MRKLWMVFPVILLLVVGTASLALAKEKSHDKDKPGIVVTDSAVVTASVEAIDYAKRTITLKGPAGNLLTTRVDDSVRNFDQVKQGDEVVATYYDSIAVYVEKKSEEPVARDLGTVQVAAPGQEPGGIVVNTAELIASVEAVNHKQRTLTLKGPAGNKVTLKVDKKVKKFKHIKPGDEVVVRHTEAVAIAVAPRK